MAVDATTITAEQLMRMADDGMRHELVRGELLVTPPPGFAHGRTQGRVATLLGLHERETGSGVMMAGTGFLLERDPDTVRAPDVAFIARERLDAVGNAPRYWPGAPDLAVEVISPGDSFHEVQEKALKWLAHGARAVLVLDPVERTATVYRGRGDARVHDSDDTLDLSDAVPGFSVAVAELFA